MKAVTIAVNDVLKSSSLREKSISRTIRIDILSERAFQDGVYPTFLSLVLCILCAKSVINLMTGLQSKPITEFITFYHDVLPHNDNLYLGPVKIDSSILLRNMLNLLPKVFGIIFSLLFVFPTTHQHRTNWKTLLRAFPKIIVMSFEFYPLVVIPLTISFGQSYPEYKISIHSKFCQDWCIFNFRFTHSSKVLYFSAIKAKNNCAYTIN